MAHKIIKGEISLKVSKNFVFKNTQTRSGENLDIAYPRVKINSDQFLDNFFVRVIKDYNKLSLTERNAKKAQFSVAAENEVVVVEVI